jgi:hypothetical protein
MATREEILIGHQLIKRVNLGNTRIDDSAYALCGENCFGEPLTQDITHEYIEKFVMEAGHAIYHEVATNTAGFLRCYPDRDQIIAGLSHFKTSLQDVETDVHEVTFHMPNAENVVALIPKWKDFAPHGKLLQLYKERVEFVARPSYTISRSDGLINTFQDILNALAFEFQGISPSTGQGLVESSSVHRSLIEAHLLVASHVEANLPDTAETRKLRQALRQTSVEFSRIKHQEPRTWLSLGESLNASVPQLPLVRRWWNYD